jgi:ABC-2 type transport system permease protein
VARQFARLKLRLIRNGLRSPQYAVLFVLGATAAGIVALIGFFVLASFRGDVSSSDATLVIFAAVTMLWIVVPLLGFGTDETLDPQRLALLPLRRGDLLRGLLAAAFVGVAPIATGLGLSGALVGQARDPLGALLIVAAIAATLLLCVTASRTLIALVAPLLRSRKGRDLLVMTLTLAALVPQAFRLFAARAHQKDPRAIFAYVEGKVRPTPFGLGGVAATEAGKQHYVSSLAALAGMAVIIAVLLYVWSRVIPRAMTSTDITPAAKTAVHNRHAIPLFPRWLPFLPHTRTGAVAAKELLYYVRDPRRRAPLITALIVPALFMFQTLRDGQARPGSTTLLALVALLPASGLTLNQFGLDGAALWAMVVSGNATKADLNGKNLATTLMVFPLVTGPALVTAWIVDGWTYLPLTIGLAPGLLGVILGIGDVVSAYAPYAVPDRKNPLASNPGQGCVGGIAALSALLVDAILLVPVGGVVVVALYALPLPAATVVSVLVAGAYGVVAWRIGRDIAADRLENRMPELLDAVSPRQAA